MVLTTAAATLASAVFTGIASAEGEAEAAPLRTSSDARFSVASACWTRVELASSGEPDDRRVSAGPFVSIHTLGLVPCSFDTTRYGRILVAEIDCSAVVAFDPLAGDEPPAPTARSSVDDGRAATCSLIVHGDLSELAAEPDSGEVWRVESETGLPASAGTRGVASLDF